MERYFFNNNENMYFFAEIKRKFDGNSVSTFSDEEISKSRMFKLLLEKGVLREITEDQYLQFLAAKNKMKEDVIQKTIADNNPAPIPYQNDLKPDPYGLNKLGAFDYEKTNKITAQRINDASSDLALDPRDVTSINYGKKETVVEAQKPVEKAQNSIESFESIASNIMSQNTNENLKTSVKGKEVWWCGPAGDAGGYGKMNRQCIEGLSKRGFKVQLYQPDNLIPDFRCLVKSSSAMEQMKKNEVSEKAPAVWGIMPPGMLPRPGKKIIFTMTETSEVQKNFSAKCNNADEVWLPSLFCMEAFERAKERGEIKKNLNLQHMPLGVDTKLYSPFKLTEEQKNALGIKTKGFVFLSLFGWSLRKGYDILLDAYLSEFKAEDDVTLLIVSRKNGSSSIENNESIRTDIKKYIAKNCPDTHPHIIHFGDSVQEEVLPVLYNLSDCFVLPSRGEGMGLIYMEAGATERPVIATRCSGQMDFLNDDNSYLVDVEGYDIACQEIKCISSYYDNVPFAVLGNQATQQTKEYMRFIYENQSEANEKGKKLRQHLVENFTWDHLVDRIEKRLS